MISESQSIFLSYASPDREHVTPYFDQLAARGFNVWMDCKSLKAGQKWDFEIKRALNRAEIIVVFISKTSVDRRGYVQREIKLALEKAEEKLINDIYLVPVLLDMEAQIPDQLKHIQFVKSWEASALEQIVGALNHQLEILGAEKRQTQSQSKVSWSIGRFQEEWDGLPGYNIAYDIINFSSVEYPSISEITHLIRGEMIEIVMSERKIKLEQSSDFMSFGQDKWQRTNTLEASCGSPVICNNIISIQYEIYSYFGGAAHPNSGFATFSFFLDPVTRINTLDEIFTNADAALVMVIDEVRKQLADKMDSLEGIVEIDKDWINEGTKDWRCFDMFIFKDDGVAILFPPYQVACYALGSHVATVKYEQIAKLMKRPYADALGVRLPL